MGVHDVSPLLWHKSNENPLQAGGVFGVDVSTMLYAILACVGVYRCLQRDPVASVQHVVAAFMDEWYNVHAFARLTIKLVFVFDGWELGLKRKRRAIREVMKRRLEAKLAGATTWQEYDKVSAKLARVNGHLVKAFCDWARDKLSPLSFCLFGAPFEADAQLVFLEAHGFTNGTLSIDSDIFFYEGSENIYSGFSTRSTKKYRSIVNRKTVDPYIASLSGEKLRTLSSFMGTDYIDHLRGVGGFICALPPRTISHYSCCPPPVQTRARRTQDSRGTASPVRATRVRRGRSRGIPDACRERAQVGKRGTSHQFSGTFCGKRETIPLLPRVPCGDR